MIFSLVFFFFNFLHRRPLKFQLAQVFHRIPCIICFPFSVPTSFSFPILSNFLAIFPPLVSSLVFSSANHDVGRNETLPTKGQQGRKIQRAAEGSCEWLNTKSQANCVGISIYFLVDKNVLCIAWEIFIPENERHLLFWLVVGDHLAITNSWQFFFYSLSLSLCSKPSRNEKITSRQQKTVNAFFFSYRVQKRNTPFPAKRWSKIKRNKLTLQSFFVVLGEKKNVIPISKHNTVIFSAKNEAYCLHPQMNTHCTAMAW